MANNVHVSARIDGGVRADYAAFGVVADYVAARSKQLESLLAMLGGGGWDAFEGLHPEHRENVVWLAGMLAAEVAGGVSELVAGITCDAEVHHG